MAEPTFRDLDLPPGLQGSGRRRYAAAMARHARGELSDAALEVFRVLALRDRDDPAPLLGAARLPEPSRSDPASAIEALRAELLDLLHRLRGPGLPETRRALAAATGPARVFEGRSGLVEPWLGPALSALSAKEPSLSRVLTEAAPHLNWQRYGYPGAEIGPAFPDAHAYCTLAGVADGAFLASNLDIGLFVMAPRLFYRDHAHPAPELYLPLTGPHDWRFAPDAPLVERPAFDPVWNDPEAPHAIKAGDVPFLALYAWLDRPGDPARVVPARDWERQEGGA